MAGASRPFVSLPLSFEGSPRSALLFWLFLLCLRCFELSTSRSACLPFYNHLHSILFTFVRARRRQHLDQRVRAASKVLASSPSSTLDKMVFFTFPLFRVFSGGYPWDFSDPDGCGCGAGLYDGPFSSVRDREYVARRPCG